MKDFFTRYRNGDTPLGSRLSTITIALNLLDRTKPNNFVETGTTRKTKYTHSITDRAADGASTVVFADFVSKFGGRVFTCDISAENIENCKIATEEYSDFITYHVGDSVEFLKNFNKPIDFLFLDSIDSDFPNASQHQLNEIVAAYDKLTPDSIVLLDDLGQKTNLSIPYLRERNWIQIILDIPYPSHYNNLMQCLMVKEEFLYVNHSLIPIEKRYKDK